MFRKAINNIFTKLSLRAIYIYQKTLSPDKGIMSPWTRGTVCRHEPHCSEYAVQSLQNRGFFDSAGDIATRVINCKPGYTKIYDPAKYKVVFASSSQIGLAFLEEIIDNPRFELVGIITQPDKAGGRGLHDISNSIKKLRKEKLEVEEIPLLEPLKLNPEKSQEGKDFARDLSLLDADFLVVISYGRIIPQAILDIPKLGPINIHGSVLPQYRGASPIQTSLLNGDKETGITIMYMDAKLDEGDIIDIYKFPITISDNSETIINKMSINGPKFMADTIIDFAHGHLHRQAQIHDQATFSNKFTKDDAKIDIYTENIKSIYQKYQGYYIWPKIRFEIGDKRFTIDKIELHKDIYISGEFSDLPLIDNNGNLNKSIKNIYIKPEGKKSMDFKARKNGYLK